MKKLLVMLLLLIVMAAISACNASIRLDRDENYSYFLLSMTEAQTGELMTNVLTSGDPAPMRNVRTDLHDGSITLAADVRDRNSGNYFPATMTVNIWQQNGALQIAIDNLQASGYSFDAAILDDINQRIRAGLAESARSNDRGSEFTEITITDTALSFTIRTPKRN